MARFDRTIPPDGEGNIFLEVKTIGYDGSIHKRAKIYSDDPKNPQASISIKARVKPIITVKPKTVHLRGLKGALITREVTIQAYEDLPLKLDDIKLSISDKVDYEMKTTKEGTVYRLIFMNKVNKEEKYRGMMQLKTNYSDKPLLKIRIYGDIKGRLQVAPERIFFGHLSMAQLKNSNQKMLLRSLNIKSVNNDQFKIDKVDYNSDLFEMNLREIQTGIKYAIDLKLPLEKIKPGNISEKLIIHTDLLDEPVKVVHISGYVR
ncbi:MAG: hypothetical protein SVY10_13320 [Thermodesulfobacteriota bacterium]|nr:hypothetical protein [Thermodesulfobacteriota bacterium]